MIIQTKIGKNQLSWSGTSSKTRIETEVKVKKMNSIIGWSGTSSKTRIETK